MTQGLRNRTTGIALGATVLVHAGIAWWLLGLRQTPPPRAASAFEVTWIERPAPAVQPRPAVPAAAQPPVGRPLPAPTPARSLQAVELDAPPIQAPGPLPDTASLLEQAGAWAREQSPAADFSRDPLRHRPAPSADGRFAMRRSITPADIAHGIGQLFGGAGYTQDPCPQIRRNIADLGTGGDAELRAEEVRRLQQFCL